jgi:hypothetical protein
VTARSRSIDRAVSGCLRGAEVDGARRNRRRGADGDVIRASVARCPAGKSISKRRGELVYRVDGAPLGTAFDALFGRVLAMFALGIAFVVIRNYLTSSRARSV